MSDGTDVDKSSGHQPMTVVQPAIIVYDNPSVYDNYNQRWAKLLGIGQLTCGIVLLILGIAEIALSSTWMFMGFQGIWMPVLIITSGAFGLSSSQNKIKCLVITTMVLSIIAVVFSLGLIGTTSASISEVDTNYLEKKPSTFEEQRSGRLALLSLMIMVALVEIVAAVCQAVVCGKVACSGGRQASASYQKDVA